MGNIVVIVGLFCDHSSVIQEEYTFLAKIFFSFSCLFCCCSLLVWVWVFCFVLLCFLFVCLV